MEAPSQSGIDPELTLTDGYCEIMGEGIVAIHQVDPDGRVHSVHVSEEDLRAILARSTGK